MSRGYRNISTISDVKYKGIHPMEKKKFIKNMNENIKEFNEFWKEKSVEIKSEIEDLFDIDANGTEAIQDLLKENGIKLSESAIEEAFANNEIQTSALDEAKILKKVSNKYSEDIQDLIEEITKSNPKETLEEKAEKADNFFEEFSKDGTNDKIDDEIQRLIGHSLAKEFKPIAKRENVQKSKNSETKKKLVRLINKLLADIDRNDDMSYEAKRKSTSSLKRFRKSFINDESSIVKRQDINFLKQTTSALAGADPKLGIEISKQQKKTKNIKDIEQNVELITNQFTKIAQSTRASKPSNLVSSVETLSQKLEPKTEKSNSKTFEEILKETKAKLRKVTPNSKYASTAKNASGKNASNKNSTQNLTEMLRESMAKKNKEAMESGEFKEFFEQAEKEAKEWAESEKKSAKQTPPAPPKNKPATNQTKNTSSSNSKPKNLKDALKQRRESMGYNDETDNEPEEEENWD